MAAIAAEPNVSVSWPLYNPYLESDMVRKRVHSLSHFALSSIDLRIVED